MEEADLLKERLLAITNKRKVQEEITRQRFQVEGEKMKLKHLKSKGLRERWLVEGITAIPLQEQEAMKKQHQEDQQQSKQLEQNILRLEEEIENLENQEVQISANEQILLEKLKTTEDVIKATKAENDKGHVQFIYSKIPDLPKTYKPCNLQHTASITTQTQEEQEPLKTALFAVEINVQKDMKTGESTVLSTVPVTVDEIRDRGVKVYEDGIKSVYAVRTDGGAMHNGVSDLTHEEVEALLEQVENKKENVSAACHAPVFSSPYHKSPSPKIPFSEHAGLESEIHENMTTNETIERHEPVMAQIYGNNDIIAEQNRKNFSESPQPTLIPSPFARSPVPGSRSPSSRWSHSELGNESPVTRNQLNSIHLQQKENHREAVFISSDLDNDGESSSADEETDIKFSIVHSLPSGVNTEDPVTMIFMGYHDIDDEDEAKKMLAFEGAIRAELVVISDDDNSNDDDATEMTPHEANGNMNPGFSPATVSSTDEKCKTSNAAIDLITGDSSTPKNSTLISGQDTATNHSAPKTYSDGQMDGVGSSEDPSVSALKARMAKLGQRVMM
ncbi:paralemmin-2 [Callorhinchus milii]|uniref:Palmdelphin n=1 Tax=Callorhinchus milii TaxID=7868 RepID=A0A4W3GZV7_CALMI|nr:paralemmin-2 [Callorhinchus milii]XP_007885292.1 paralemmin-2 [Callorhinchus milii]|eukprot:gi/632940385/ref/XP_007885291.1/ PREDICTED: palmdelphin [Callorhinchus milii]